MSHPVISIQTSEDQAPLPPIVRYEEPVPLEPVVDLSPGHVLRLTPNEIAMVDKAMVEAQGDRATAAKLLGVAYVQLSFCISRVPALRSQWIRNDEGYVTDVESSNPRLASRNAPGEVSSEDELRAEALTKVEKKISAVGPEKSLNKSLHKLGFKVSEVEKLTSMEELAGQNFTATLALLHGGIIKGSARLMLLMETVEQEYLMRDDLSESDRKFWWENYFRIIESLRSLADQSNKAAITRALVKQKGQLGGPGKPGFTAVQVNISKDK